MNVVIYNINSFGGNYEYAKFLFKAYQKNPSVDECLLLMPSNAAISGENILKILHPDIPKSKSWFNKKIHFIYRSLVNPFRLYAFLKKQPGSVVLFNDYDQHTALFWVPFLSLLKKKHRFAVMLHDPDRDAYFSLKAFSRFTMRMVMSLMDVAFFHGFLPERNYYKGSFLKIVVPHGIYDDSSVDQIFLSRIKMMTGNCSLIGILGNIRPEKNYEIIIDALAQLENVMLLVAGKVANSGVSVKQYKEYAEKKKVAQKIIWMDEYLSQSAFNAAVEACDVIMLYYKPTFKSQSGVLNAIAPFAKKLIISDTESALKECVAKYKLGSIVSHNNLDGLVKAIKDALSVHNNSNQRNWKNYMNDSSWDQHVSIAVGTYNKVI